MSVLQFPSAGKSPQHVAIIMDGNRRWAQKRALPKALGHARGAQAIHRIVQACADQGIHYLTLFTFSTENWQRPQEEVSSLIGLFVQYLENEIGRMEQQGVRLKVVGDLGRFDVRLQSLIRKAQEQTAGNTRITLTLAANYGGRWDMLQATRAWQLDHPHQSLESMDEDSLRPYLSMAYAPDPDLLVRTGGESRISNFLLWQSAYTELFFTPALWPDFSPDRLNEALAWYAQRDRRFGGSSQRATG